MRTQTWMAGLAVAATLGIEACAYSIHSVRPGNAPAAIPSASDSVCVMLAADGIYGTRTYAGSGRAVSNRILTAVRAQRPFAQLIEVTDEDQAAQLCVAKGGSYLLSPIILHWEDRATNWSGVRDLIKIEVRLIRIEPRTLVRSTEFEARNNWFTFVNADPSELLDASFDRTIVELVQS